MGQDTFEILSLNITLPNSNGTWPEELGGRLYPPERGRLSQLFHLQLHDDCPDCPYMPDPDNGTDFALAAALRSEAYMFLPMW